MDRLLGLAGLRSDCVPHRRGDGPGGGEATRTKRRRSPQAWGWTVQLFQVQAVQVAFPTGVGMDRINPAHASASIRVPHRRGDGPPPIWVPPARLRRSPQAWGWTVLHERAQQHQLAFPTGVGMDRLRRPGPLRALRVPHRRGDGPVLIKRQDEQATRSPQAWGWTVHYSRVPELPNAFPTGVGMDRNSPHGVRSSRSVPHRRGDGPPRFLSSALKLARSPQAWGWTARLDHPARFLGAFPTGVGMDLQPHSGTPRRHGVPHRRGDGPRHNGSSFSSRQRSPQAWGWTALSQLAANFGQAFPTGVGMDRGSVLGSIGCTRVPHRRGDGPQ
ncbi:hypothetical protein DGo_PE0012 (plasmid) [Deinococcus gobiensis I-0]|uniref:Uncharacterized protein n=1 Tax=Deinococcus gobiensis (strain DSM 21396 / JCM 16679 / CGMCC 1.7299 / I-0) TaxID=745776 RepID=H8H3Q9_DEIGI|nr:hypothetical protein DGo_PE0012 [Deinococcus gobiensis I-0]